MRWHTWDAGRLVGPPLTEEEEAIWDLPMKKMDLENDWNERWATGPGQASEAGSEKEQVWALYHFVRRMFLSSRLTPVLTERAGR